MTHTLQPDWRFTFPGTDSAAEMRRWIHNRLLELERGQLRQATESMRNFPSWRNQREWRGMPAEAARTIAEHVVAAWAAARDEDPESAQYSLGRALELL